MAADTKIIISAEDKTSAAFRTAEASLSGLAAGAARVSSLLSGLGVGAIAGGGFLAFVKGSIDAADNLNDLSKKTGVAVDDLAGLQLVVDKSGTSMEMLGNGIGKLNKYMGEAALGNEDARATLAALGVTAKTPMEAFIQLADAFGRFEDEGQRAAVMSKVIGKTWGELAPALSEGADGLRDMIALGKELNPITQEMADRADRLNDRLAALNISLKGAGTGLAEFFLDLLPNSITMSETDARIKELEADIGSLNRHLKDAPGKGWIHRWMYGTSDDMNAQIAASVKELQRLRLAQAAAAFVKAEGGRPPIVMPEQTAAEAEKLRQAMERAFDTRPLDDYVENLKRQAVTIRQEYAAMRAEAALGATPDNPTGLDISTGIMQTREALAGGDTTKAQALAARTRDMLRSSVNAGAPGFETDYLSRQVEALELQMNEMAQKTASKTRDIFRFNLEEWRGVIAAMPPVEIPLALETMKEQIRGAVKAIFTELASDPFVLPVQIPVNEVSSAGLQRAALKLGGR